MTQGFLSKKDLTSKAFETLLFPMDIDMEKLPENKIVKTGNK
jgi:hypothetical protein